MQRELHPQAIRSFGKCADKRDGGLQVGRRFGVCRSLDRLLRRQPQVFDRLRNVIAAAVMTRQLAQMVVQLLGEHRLERLAGAFVQELAALDQPRVVSHFLRQRVLEGVLDVGKRRLLVDELAELKVRQHPLQLSVRFADHPLYQAEPEFLAHYSQGLQQVFLIRRQPVDARCQDALHRGRNFQFAQRLGEFDRSIAHQRPFIEENLHRLLHEEWVALRLLDNHPLERSELGAIAQQRSQQLPAALLAERIEPQLSIVSLVPPFVAILGPVGDQQQDTGGGQHVHQQVQQSLSSRIDPVQILEDNDQWLVETLAQQQPLDRLQCPSLPDLRIHLGKRIVRVAHAEEREQVNQRVFQSAIQRKHFAGDFLAPLAFVILDGDLEIILEQVDQRQVRRGLAMRD